MSILNFAYLIVNFLVIVIPLFYSFDRRVLFYKKWKSVLLSTLICMTLFLIWDYWFTKIGVWGFNDKFITGFRILNLPVEEVLFFITIPYAMYFTYEAVGVLLKEKRFKTNVSFFILLSWVCFFLGFVFVESLYTFTIFMLNGFLVLILSRFEYISWYFCLYLLLGFLGFLVVNTVLTYMPIVQYDSQYIIGGRVGYIPIEDFLYNFFMLTVYLLIYLYLKERIGGKV